MPLDADESTVVVLLGVSAAKLCRSETFLLGLSQVAVVLTAVVSVGEAATVL